MTMKNIKLSIFAATLTGLTLVSCNDLDTEPLGSTITSDQKEETVAADPGKMMASVTAITSMFNQYANAIPSSFGHDDFGFGSIMLNLDCRGIDMPGIDNGYNWYTYSMTFEDLNYNYRQTNILWRTMYNQIYTANAVTKVVAADTEDNQLKYFLAQALAIRAFDYFTLAQMYQQTYKGNESKLCVPILTEENADDAATNGCARATVEETYAQIKSDIDCAIELLESTTIKRSDKRYISKEVAYGIRARINLVMQNWSEAASDAQKAIDGSGKPYSMEEVSTPTFTESSDHSWMWGIIVAETDRVVTSGIVNFPSQMGSLNYGYASVGAWRLISKTLFNMIPESDVRKGWWLDEKGFSPNLDAAQVAQAKQYGCPPYTQMKYGPYQGKMGQSTNASDIPLMRVEEMYLILAEAQAMSGNAATGATTLENFVKTYRNPEYQCRATSAEAVQDEVWLQRRIELWGEGLSYFDLMRLGKGIDRRGAGFPAAYVFNIPAGDGTLIYRIPQTEEEANALITPETNNPVCSIPTPVADI